MNPKQNRPYVLREKKVPDLVTGVAALRQELSELRVSKVSSGVASKLAKIRVSILLFDFFQTPTIPVPPASFDTLSQTISIFPLLVYRVSSKELEKLAARRKRPGVLLLSISWPSACEKSHREELDHHQPEEQTRAQGRLLQEVQPENIQHRAQHSLHTEEKAKVTRSKKNKSSETSPDQAPEKAEDPKRAHQNTELPTEKIRRHCIIDYPVSCD